MSETTYLIVDGENIDATLGLSVLNRRPEPEERPRWDRVLEYVSAVWDGPTKGLFFLNATSGHLPMSFIQALLAMNYQPIPLSGPLTEKVVDVGIQRTLEAIMAQGRGNVVLASHDGDFGPQMNRLLENGHQLAIVGFEEFLSGELRELADRGLQVIDLEHQVKAFTARLPRIHILSLDEFDPTAYL